MQLCSHNQLPSPKPDFQKPIPRIRFHFRGCCSVLIFTSLEKAISAEQHVGALYKLNIII